MGSCVTNKTNMRMVHFPANKISEKTLNGSKRKILHVVFNGITLLPGPTSVVLKTKILQQTTLSSNKYLGNVAIFIDLSFMIANSNNLETILHHVCLASAAFGWLCNHWHKYEITNYLSHYKKF